MNVWNGEKFSVYSSEEKSVLGLIKTLGTQTNHNTDELENVKNSNNQKVSFDDMEKIYKLFKDGNFIGSWHGIERPSLSNEGMYGIIETLNKHYPLFINNGGKVNGEDNSIRLNNYTGKMLILSDGEYTISQDTVINYDIMFLTGAVIKIINNATLTINGQIQSNINKIFNIVSGNIKINIDKNPFGYAEYFGAKMNDGTVDNKKAIEQCVKLFPTTFLQLGDYFCSDTVNINTSRRKLIGHSNYNLGERKSTRIIVNSSTKDTMFVGLEEKPSEIYDFLTNVTIKNIELGRSIVPTPSSPGLEASSPKGLRVQYCYMCNFEFVRATENSIGFYITGTVYTHFKRCTSFRSLQGTTTNNDFYYGYFINGTTNIGLASGNASLYFTDCNSSLAGNPNLVDSVGFFVLGKSSDIFMLRSETTGVNTGILISGDESKDGNLDVHIINPIIDQFQLHGIFIQNIGKYGIVEISNSYCAPISSERDGYCIRFNNFKGMANLTNNQGVLWQNGVAIGLWIENSTGIVCKNNSYLGAKRPIVILDSQNICIEDIINNPVEKAIQGAIYCKGVSRSIIKPIIKGGANVFPQGIFFLDATGGYNEVGCSGIDSSCIVGNNINKVVYNSSQQITTNTTFGTGNITTGIMA